MGVKTFGWTPYRTHDRHGQSVRLSPRTPPAAPVMTYRLVQTRSRRAPRVPHSLRTRRHFAPVPPTRPPPVHQPPAHARPVSACARRGSGGGPPLQRGAVLASDGLFKTRAAARRDVTAAQRAAQGVPKRPQPTVVSALLSMALTTLSTQLNSRLVTALLSTALTTLSAQLNSTQAVSKRLVTALLSTALTVGFAAV